MPRTIKRHSAFLLFGLALYTIAAAILVVAFIYDLNRPVSAATLPPGAVIYCPMLASEARSAFPEAPATGWLCAQVHKESCITATHPKCWNPRSELKTSREYGFGFGQITVAYRADGSERFNTFKEVRRLDPRLATWQWDDRYDPHMQLRALLVKNRINYKNVVGAANDNEHVAFALVGYNAGAGSVLADRRLCQGTPKCNPNLWFGNVENTSMKSRTVMPGYGRSPFQISRDYPQDILHRLTPQYASFFVASSH